MGESKTKTGSITGDSLLKMGVNAAYHPHHQTFSECPIPRMVFTHDEVQGRMKSDTVGLTALNTHDCKPVCNSCRAMVNRS